MNDIELKRKLETLLPTGSGSWNINSPIGKLFSLVASIPEEPLCYNCGTGINIDYFRIYSNNNMTDPKRQK